MKKINWNKVIKEYPKAYELLWMYFFKTHKTMLSSCDVDSYIRKDCLYDFFDHHNLNVVITPEYYVDGVNWCWRIMWPEESEDCYNYTMMYGDDGEYPTRHDAEVAAFERAFEELENKLKK